MYAIRRIKRVVNAEGRPSKATAAVRAIMALIAEPNVLDLERWLDSVAKENPAKGGWAVPEGD